MKTIGQQIFEPEGTPDEFQLELERRERAAKPRMLYPHSTLILADLGKTVTYLGPPTSMTRVERVRKCRDAAMGKFDSANWSVSDIASVGEKVGTPANGSRVLADAGRSGLRNLNAGASPAGSAQ